jgi:hypothetical protein
MNGRHMVIAGGLAAALLSFSYRAPAAITPLGLTSVVGWPCGACERCDPEAETMKAPEDGLGLFDVQEDCEEGPCTFSKDPRCQVICPFPPEECPPPGGGGESAAPSSAELVAMWNALVSGDNSAIRLTIAAYPDRVIVNPIRSAVQIIGCSGAIVASIPMDSGRLSAITEP